MSDNSIVGNGNDVPRIERFLLKPIFIHLFIRAVLVMPRKVISVARNREEALLGKLLDLLVFDELQGMCLWERKTKCISCLRLDVPPNTEKKVIAAPISMLYRRPPAIPTTRQSSWIACRKPETSLPPILYTCPIEISLITNSAVLTV